MTTLLFKLAFAGIRSRLLASGLTIAMAGAASAMIVLALEVRSSGVDPWQRTFDAANGAHVLAFVPTQADARTLAELPGVTERGEPVAGLSGRTAVNKPVLTAGSQLREDGIVLERSLANALGLDVGDRLAVTGRHGTVHLPVLGTAVVPSQARYPRSIPGLAWVTPATLERVEPDRTRWSWTEALRLANPSAAEAFTDERQQASRQQRCGPALSPSRPGKTSATTRWVMHRARR
jgi:putative ABC transport system permease protein